MSRGIYFLANDRVREHAIALLASLRAHDPEVPVVLIPYDDAHHEVTRVAAARFDVRVWEDDATLGWIDAELHRVFGAGFFRRPGNFRKQACWFGPFEEFLYLDADIVVFEPIVRLLDELARAEFVCCDDQHEGGLRHVFTREVLRSGDLPRRALRDVFNGGLFGARRGLVTRASLVAAWEAAARRIACFDFAHGGSDQPILNDLVLRTLPRRVNAYRRPGAPRMWAGTPGFVADGPGYLTDPRGGRRLRFLHWAGVPIGPGGPYWDVWRHWRERDPALPPTTLPAVRRTPPLAPRRRARAAAALRRTVARLAAVLPGGR